MDINFVDVFSCKLKNEQDFRSATKYECCMQEHFTSILQSDISVMNVEKRNGKFLAPRQIIINK